MVYKKTLWVNGVAPAINSDNLNNMEDGIFNSVNSVDTLADLRLISAPASKIHVTGYNTKNDGAFGSNIYRLKGIATTEVDNGGTIILVTIGLIVYAYELQYEGAIDARYFGAVGDAIVDDTLAIQASINYCVLNNIALYVSRIFKTTAELTIPQNINPGGAYGITMYGDNSTWTSISGFYAVHTDASILSLKGSNGSRIEGLRLYSDQTTFPKTAMILGRDANGDSCGWHNISRIWIDGKFSVAGVYSIASEENKWSGIFMQIQGGGAKYGFYSSTGDVLLVDNLPPNSNIANSIDNMHIWNWQAISDSACIYLETAEAMGSWSFKDCYCIPKSGSYYQINNGVLDGLRPVGPFTFIGCGGEIYNAVSPYLDSPDNGFRISSLVPLEIPGITILNSRCQLINAASTRKILNVDANIGLIKPNIVMQGLEDPATSFSVFRAKVKGGIFDVADSSEWIPLNLQTVWVDKLGAPYAPASFQVDATGTLRLRGSVGSGGIGGAVIAILPAGFEPPYNMTFSTQDNGVNATILVLPSGNIQLSVGTGTAVDLSAVVFKLVDP